MDGSDAAEKEDCELTELFFETFQICDAISVHFENTILPYHVYKDIARKLCDCQQLEQLVLSNNDFCFFNQRLDKVIRRLTSLKQFSLREHPMSAHQCKMLMESLHQLPLEELDLRDVTMTRSTEALVAPSGFPTLKKLALVDTRIGKEDLDFLFKTDTSYLPELEELVLSDQTMTVRDIKSLFEAIHYEKLLHLKKFALDYIVLTGSFGDLIGDAYHAGFSSLKEFCLKRTEPNEEDIHKVAEVIKKNKFPNLEILDLATYTSDENMHEMIENLAEVCIARYKTKFILQLDIPRSFEEKLDVLCRNTTVHINLESLCA